MRWKVWLGIIVSAFFLFIAFQKIDFARLWIALKGANYLYLIPVVVLNYLSIVFRSIRWLQLLQPLKAVHFYSAFLATSLGFMALFLLPARLGEIIRPYFLGSKENLSKSAAFGTVVVERLIDVFTILLLLAIVLISTDFAPEKAAYQSRLATVGYAFMGISLLAVGFLFFLKFQTELALRWISLVLSPLPKRFSKKIIELITAFVEGIVVIKGLKSWGLFLLYTALLWLTPVLGINLLTMSFGIELPFMATIFVLVVIAFGVSLPAAPGFVGTFHAAGLYALLFYGVNREEALSLAIVMHLSNAAPLILLGFFLLWYEGISMKEVKGVNT
jgi:uncharacterized protein (TIRG00374 family)